MSDQRGPHWPEAHRAGPALTPDDYGVRGSRSRPRIQDRQEQRPAARPPEQQVEEALKEMTSTIKPSAIVEQAAEQAAEEDDAGAQERVRTQMNAVLDMASQHVVARIRKLRKQCEDLEQLILSDCGRVKAEINQHVELATEAAKQSDAVEAVLKKLRSDRARLIKANVASADE